MNTRPPPAACNMVARALRATASQDLRELEDRHPHEFNALLAHAAICDDCSESIKAAFPAGFTTAEEQRALDRRLNEVSDELEGEMREAPAQAPKRGLGTERGGSDG